jgi:hypothetical protein
VGKYCKLHHSGSRVAAVIKRTGWVSGIALLAQPLIKEVTVAKTNANGNGNGNSKDKDNKKDPEVSSLTVEEIEAEREKREKRKKKAEDAPDAQPPPYIPPASPDEPTEPEPVENNDTIILTGDADNPIIIIIPGDSTTDTEGGVSGDPNSNA